MAQDPQRPPNRKVKLVFEQVDTEDEEVKGCKVYLEFEGREINDEVLQGEDRTVAECWAAEVFDYIRQQIQLKMLAQGGYFGTQPKKEEMN